MEDGEDKEEERVRILYTFLTSACIFQYTFIHKKPMPDLDINCLQCPSFILRKIFIKHRAWDRSADNC